MSSKASGDADRPSTGEPNGPAEAFEPDIQAAWQNQDLSQPDDWAGFHAGRGLAVRELLQRTATKAFVASRLHVCPPTVDATNVLSYLQHRYGGEPIDRTRTVDPEVGDVAIGWCFSLPGDLLADGDHTEFDVNAIPMIRDAESGKIEATSLAGARVEVMFERLAAEGRIQRLDWVEGPQQPWAPEPTDAGTAPPPITGPEDAMSVFTLWAVSYLSDGTEVLAGKYMSSDQAEQAKQAAEAGGERAWISEELWTLGADGATQIGPKGCDDEEPESSTAAVDDHMAAAMWSELTGSLAQALRTLTHRQSISLSSGDSHWVQFSALEDGMRAGTVSDGYLPDEGQLTPDQDAALRELGWLPPIDGDNVYRAQNYYRDYPTPVSFAEVATLGVRTLVEVHGITYPQELHYQAHDSVARRKLSFPALRVPYYHSDNEAVGALTNDPVRDVQDLLLEAIQTVDPDAQGWDVDEVLTIRFGSVLISFRVVDDPPIIRICSSVLTGVIETVHLLRELNDINNQADFARLSLTPDGAIVVADELHGLPFVSKHALSATAAVGQLADSLVQRLRVRHGGIPDDSFSGTSQGPTRGLSWAAPGPPGEQP
jgi:hypothetical protein